MTDQTIAHTHCYHYPDRALQKKDLAVEIGGVCEKTVDNLVRAGKLPKPCWLNSIPVWMLHDVHAFIRANAGKARRGDTETEAISGVTSGKKVSVRAEAGSTHKAGKYRA